MAIVIRSIKNAFLGKFQKGNRIQLPLNIVKASDLKHGQKWKGTILEKGDVIPNNGIFITFLDESMD